MTKSLRACFCLLLGVALLGCGGERVADVNGTVTLDGEPLKGAMITFQPEDGARPSMGVTDDSGRYSLQRGPTVSGAVVGKHRVSITTGTEKEDESGKTIVIKERVPVKYNVKSELVKDVESGSNTIDFALDSKGEVIGVGAKPPKVERTSCGGEEEEDTDY